MKQQTQIKDLTFYNQEMRKSLFDKAFFLDKIDGETVVDFGCADGTLTEFIKTLFPEKSVIGYDINEEEIYKARENGKACKYFFNTSFIDEIEPRNSTLLLSSVIHEVYNYSTLNEIEEFWNFVFKNNWKEIVIRDMIPSMSIERKADVNDYSKILSSKHSNKIRSFEQEWGSLENNKNLIHFLLKYRYEINWEREVKENYMPLLFEQLLSLIPNYYEITFEHRFILPFIKKNVKKEFNIDIKDNTHTKLILERKNG